MIINNIKLRNIKTYGDDVCSIDFNKGINLIHGDNGSGKTTIIEAIGFALFGDNVFEHKRKETGSLLREGQKEGEVILTISIQTHDRGLCRYRIQRTIKRNTTKVRIFDDLTDQDLSDTIEDIDQWILNSLDLGGMGGENEDEDSKIDQYIKFLYRAVVCVGQGEMTNLFQETYKTVRNKTFTTLLKANELLMTKMKMGEIKTTIDNDIRQKTQQIREIDININFLSNSENVLQELNNKLADDRVLETEYNQNLLILSKEKDELLFHQKKITQLGQEIELNQIKTHAAQQRLADNQQKVEQAKDAKQIISQTEAGFRTYEQAIKRQDELNALRTKRDAIKGDLSLLQKRMGVLDAEINQNTKQLSEIERAQEHIIELIPLFESQQRINNELSILNTDIAAIEEIRRNMKTRQRNLEKLLESKIKAEGEYSRRLIIEKEYQEAQKYLLELNNLLKNETEHITSLQDVRASVQSNLNDLQLLEQKYGFSEKQIREEKIKLADATDIFQKHNGEAILRNKLQGEIDNLNFEKEELEKVLKEISGNVKSIEKSIKDSLDHQKMLGSAHQSCPLCRKQLTPEEAIDLGKKISQEIEGLASQKVEFEKNIQEKEIRIDELINERQIKVKQLSKLVTPAEQYRHEEYLKRLTENILQMESEHRNLYTNNEELNKLRLSQEENILNIETATKTKDGLDSKRTDADQNILNLNGQLQKLSTSDRVHEIVEEIRQNQLEIAADEERLIVLKRKTEEKDRLESQLKVLGDPAGETAIERNVISKKGSLLSQKGELEIEKDQRQTEIERYLHDLIPYATLDDDVLEISTALNRHQSDHNQYLENQNTAATLESLQNLAQEYEADCTKLNTEKNQRTEELETEKLKFDPNRFTTVETQINDLSALLSEICVRREVIIKQLQENQDKFNQLREFISQRAKVEKDMQLLSQREELLKFVIACIDTAYPRILEKRRTLISETARDFLRKILNNDMIHLEIDDDYTVVVRFDKENGMPGTNRPFARLSGGEQMSVALSVRMAILECMSNLRIMFLDEPTANLDKRRKVGLATSVGELERMKALQQIFVITHDDSFNCENPHLIQVFKKNGLSRVEVGGSPN